MMYYATKRGRKVTLEKGLRRIMRKCKYKKDYDETKERADKLFKTLKFR